MSSPLENYALLSNCHSAALVGLDGSIDWLAFPCFDSPALFASLLGNKENGRWLIHPKGKYQSTRKYVDDTVVLETIFKTETGECKLTDCMAIDHDVPTLIRSIECLDGSSSIEFEIILRFDYGSIVPWVRRTPKKDGIYAIAGPEAIVLYSPVTLEGRDLHTLAEFTLKAGEKRSFSLMWYRSHEAIPEEPHIDKKISSTIDFWQTWVSQCKYRGFDEADVRRSLITLKALTYHPTGAIVAAPTTSLPELIGGERNWDYRFSWIRDSSFTLYALLKAGYINEAVRWKEWLLRAVAGTPYQVNIMYGIRGERRLTEIELDWLNGYENSKPTRIGNAAYQQFQIDVFGELLSTSHLGRQNGIHINHDSWRIEKKMLEYVIEHWREPDEGIWEVRGPKRHFTHSKLMAWVAFESAIESTKEFGLEGDIDLWTQIKEEIHQDICQKGFNKKKNAFVQYYGSEKLDSSLLMMNIYNFLPIDDPRMVATVDAIQKELMKDGLLLRYKNRFNIDGLIGQEGCFLACTFWLVDNLRMMGKTHEALELYHQLKSLKNDVGLFAEEYSPLLKKMVGNYPQAFSHIAHAVSAMGLNYLFCRSPLRK